MAEKSIKSGEEVVKEFFDKIRKDKTLDELTREALFLLYQHDKFTKTQISKALETVRQAALGGKNDEAEENQD